MAFKFLAKKLEGLYEVVPEIFSDVRGSFFECYNEKDFFTAGLTMKFVQDNQSVSKKGVVRGMHFQKEHPQGKLVRCLSGKIFDVAVDIRPESKTYLDWEGVLLDGEKKNMFYIPEGFAHGFCVLSDTAEVFYKCSDFYYPGDEGGILWNDPSVGINWESVFPGINECAVLSIKDKCYSLLKN